MSGGWGTPSRQGGDLDVGEVFVQGKDQQTARDLLDACDQLGVDRLLVRTTIHGFVVPGEVWDQAQDTRRASQGLTI